jgi:hypothetical protein
MAQTVPLAQRRPRPTARELIHEIGTVLADLPRFATAPLYRRWHQRWGAITIDAPPAAVWPWLVQVGCLRAGFYADDLLDNLGHPSAREILPEFQQLEIGQWVPMSPTPSDTTAFEVAGFEENHCLLWQQPLSTWSWTLTKLPASRTRLVTRIRIHRDWHHPAAALLSVFLTDFGDFAMMRRMLLGIRDRAQATGGAA